ncbi:MAG: hypothetical protein ACT4N5_08615 [Nitrosopumilaceae archaeon]
MAIVADGEEGTFFATGKVILPDGFTATKTGSESWRGAFADSIHLKIFFELTPSWDVNKGNYTLAVASSNQNSAVSKYFKISVLDNLNVGFPKTNVTEIYHLKGNFYSPERKLEFHNFKIPYKISNATIERINVDQLSESSVVNIESFGDGLLDVAIPRNLFDQKSNFTGDLIDDQLYVFIDEREAKFTELKTPCFRNLSIPFPDKTKVIAIAGVNYLMGPEPFASDVSPIYLVTNSKNYTKGDTIAIFGCTSLNINEEKMNLDIIDPDGRNLTSRTIIPNLDGTFLYKLDTKNEFATDGDYSIIATFGNHTNTRTVTVPEFPLAFLVLMISVSGSILFMHKVGTKLSPR